MKPLSYLLSLGDDRNIQNEKFLVDFVLSTNCSLGPDYMRRAGPGNGLARETG